MASAHARSEDLESQAAALSTYSAQLELKVSGAGPVGSVLSMVGCGVSEVGCNHLILWPKEE